MNPTAHGGARRVAAFFVVVLLHVGILAVLSQRTEFSRARGVQVPARLILQRRERPPEPPPVNPPPLAVPPALVPPPDLGVSPPVGSNRPMMARASVAAPPDHFGQAGDAGLGLDVAAAPGGGSGDRGSLAAFEAAVRRQVLAGKRQPALAWDRRDTCVIGYVVHIDAGGRLSGFSIDPCAVPELNEAARAAIRDARYPSPPGFGARSTEVHGSLIFRP